MASSINATSTGSGGIIQTADATGVLNIQTNETTAITVGSTQNVGIGTSSPGYRLTAAGASTAGSVTALALENPSTNGASEVRQEWRAGGSSWAYITSGYNSNSPFMAFGVSAASSSPTERMRIDSSGNLGLGVTPSAWRSGDVVLDIGSVVSLVSAQSANTRLYNNTYVASGGTNTYKTTAAASYYDQGSGIHRWFNAPSGTAGNAITFTQAMTLDASGRLGIGTTSPISGSTLTLGNDGTSGATVKLSMSTATTERGYVSMNGGTGELQVAAGYAGYGGFTTFYTGGTERARIDSNGNFGIGTSSPAYKLDVLNAGGGEITRIGSSTRKLYFYADSGGVMVGTGATETGTSVYFNEASSFLYFQTNSIERARIDSSGNLLVGLTSTINSAALTVKKAVNDNVALFDNSGGSSPYGIQSRFSGVDLNNTGSHYFEAWSAVNSVYRFYVRSNGGISNYQANDTNLSDRREKTNFAPAGEYLSKICAIPVQTFNYIDQNMEEDDGLTLGVVAQDVQAVAPELVSESNWGSKEEPKMRLSIYQTDLQYALMKCIQEQQSIIEQLKADVAALKGA
jgi:Chaperone of endosialidase